MIVFTKNIIKQFYDEKWFPIFKKRMFAYFQNYNEHVLIFKIVIKSAKQHGRLVMRKIITVFLPFLITKYIPIDVSLYVSFHVDVL